jgi:hypothetical protein
MGGGQLTLKTAVAPQRTQRNAEEYHIDMMQEGFNTLVRDFSP